MLTDSDLHALVTNDVAAAPLPQFSMSAIRARSQALQQNGFKKRILAVIAAIVLVPSLALAYTSHETFIRNIIAGFRAYGVPLPLNEPFVMARRESLAQAMRAARFAVVLPTGLPNGTRMQSTAAYGHNYVEVVYALRGRGTATFDLYRNGRGKSMAPFVYVAESDTSGNVRSMRRLHAYTWVTGDEFVFAYSSSLRAAQFDAIRRAMHGTVAPPPSAARLRGLKL